MMGAVRFLILTFFMLVGYAAFAQDRIYFSNGEPADAVVREIGDDYVLYRMWDNQDGPDFRASLSRVDKIVFRNGNEMVFKDRPVNVDDLMMSGAVIPGRLDYRHGRYYMGVSVMSPQQVIDYLGYKNYGSAYLKAKRQYAAGVYLSCIGGAFALLGIVSLVTPDPSDNFPSNSFFADSGSSDKSLGITACALGGISLVIGIPLLTTGNKKLDAIADEYNERNGYSLKPAERKKSLTLGGCNSGGIGLAFNF